MTSKRRFGTVIFDCDSTLSTIEGIEELARDHRVEVEALTTAAMRGEVPLEEVYGRRLALVNPSREQVQDLGRRYIETLVPGARRAIETLHREGVQVRVISGGLKPAVLILAQALGIEPAAVEAVDVYFTDGGAYRGYDAASPLAASGGKRSVIERWAEQLPRPIMLIGDGATDQEAQDVVDQFVAFAGVVVRPAVVAAAAVVIREPSLKSVIPLALGRQVLEEENQDL